SIPDHRALLEDDLHQALQELRVFLEVNPRLLILTSAMRLSWDNGVVGGVREPVESERRIPEWHPEIITEDSPSGDLRRLYAEIERTLDLPSPNLVYRMLGQWPDYLVAAWQDLRTYIGTPACRSAVRT